MRLTACVFQELADVMLARRAATTSRRIPACGGPSRFMTAKADTGGRW